MQLRGDSGGEPHQHLDPR